MELGLRAALVAACSFFPLVPGLSPGAEAQQVEAVVLKREVAPETGLGQFNGFRRPAISDDMPPSLAFRSKVSGGSEGGTRGVFQKGPGGTDSKIVKRGDLASSLNEFRHFISTDANARGDVVFRSRLRRERGIYRNGPTDPIDVARSGDLPPAPLTGAIDRFGRAVTNDTDGDIVFRATIADATFINGGIEANKVIFRCFGDDVCTGDPMVADALEPLVIRGDIFVGGQICDIDEEVSVSDYGIAFRASIRPNCTTLGPETDGLFRQAFGGTVETIALIGDSAPGIFGDYRKFIGRVAIQNTGVMAYIATTTDATNPEAVYRCDTGCSALATLPELFVAAFETGDDGALLSRFEGVGISDAADVSFSARASSVLGNLTGIYLKHDAGGAPERIACRNGPVGNLPLEDGSFGKIFPPTMSPGGIIAWRGKLKRSRDKGGSANGLFWYNPNP